MATSTARLTAYVETLPGLEEVAWLEVRRRFPAAQFREFLFARDERGIAVFDTSARPGDLFALRTVESIFLAGVFLPDTTRGYRDLRQLREQMVRSGDFGGAVNAFSRYRRRQVSSYRLIVRTYGKHEYDRQAVRRAVIQGIEQLYPQWQRVQDDPDVEIWANVLGSAILVGLRLLPPRPMDGAAQGGLPTSAAAALVLLSDPQDNDLFLDPFANGGDVVAARMNYPYRLLLGGILQSATDAPDHDFVRWDGGRLPLPAGAVNKIATRFPPVAAGDVVQRYTVWLLELQRVLLPGATVVVLTHAFDQFKEAIRQTPHLEVRGGYSVTVSGEWGRIYLLQRSESVA